MNNEVYKVFVPEELTKHVAVGSGPLDLSAQTDRLHPDKIFIWATDESIDKGLHINMLLTQEGCPWQFVPLSWVTTSPEKAQKEDLIYLPFIEPKPKGVDRVYWGGHVLMWCNKDDFKAARRKRLFETQVLQKTYLRPQKLTEDEEDFGTFEERMGKSPIEIRN
uniref:Uncharacterized protein n=1 Tax=Hot spring virus BHS2 TaxID=2024352 RepID=A0A2U7NW30_9VIRU|nr:hypothetical protein [Hot spring virus BHS2]